MDLGYEKQPFGIWLRFLFIAAGFLRANFWSLRASYHVSQGVGIEENDETPAQEKGHDEANSFGCVFTRGCTWNGKYLAGAVSPSPALLVAASSSRLQGVLADFWFRDFGPPGGCKESR